MNDSDEKFLTACQDGNLEQVRYYLTSPELNILADINVTDNEGWTGLMKAAFNEDIEIMNYLLTSDELSLHADINQLHPLDFNTLMISCFYEKIKSISYLINDYDIEINKDTMNWLNGENAYNKKYSIVLDMIEKKEMSKSLNINLTQKNSNKRTKI